MDRKDGRRLWKRSEKTQLLWLKTFSVILQLSFPYFILLFSLIFYQHIKVQLTLSTRGEKAFIQKFQNMKYKINKKNTVAAIFLNFRQ